MHGGSITLQSEVGKGSTFNIFFPRVEAEASPMEDSPSPFVTGKGRILLVDDLQWADSGSINLLFHLGKRLEGSRILVVGAYRPTEVALGRGGERHPLEPVINEFKRQFGEIQIDLSQAEGRAFVNALLDTDQTIWMKPFARNFSAFRAGIR
jgi:hypothetical protein